MIREGVFIGGPITDDEVDSVLRRSRSARWKRKARAIVEAALIGLSLLALFGTMYWQGIVLQ